MDSGEFGKCFFESVSEIGNNFGYVVGSEIFLYQLGGESPLSGRKRMFPFFVAKVLLREGLS